MDIAFYGSVVVTLFVIMDPIGIIPIFLALVGRRSPAEVRRLALQAALTSLVVITGFALFGDRILEYLHISLPALRVAGGLLLLVVALQLLLHGDVGGSAAEDDANIAFVPLGTPLLAGPGAIVAVILLVRDSTGPPQLVAIAAAIVSIHIVIYLVLRYATAIIHVIRPAGVTIISRIAGVLLAAIAVQLTADGVFGLIEMWQA